jgi:predicted Holliday junction resolvase-like endonuclease
MVTFISYVEIWRSIPILTIVLLISIIVIYKAAVKIDSTRGEEFHKKDETEDTITASMKNLIDKKKINYYYLTLKQEKETDREPQTTRGIKILVDEMISMKMQRVIIILGVALVKVDFCLLVC